MKPAQQFRLATFWDVGFDSPLMLSSPRHLLDQAAAAFAGHDLLRAESACRRALEADAKSADAWRLMGRIRTRQSEFDAAEDCFAKAAKLAPRDAEVPFGRGQLRLRQGRYTEAAALFADAVRRKPGHPEAGLMLAEAHRMNGEPSKALALLAAPTSGLAFLILGECCVGVGDLVRAERALRDGIALGGDVNTMTRLHRRLGELLERSGRPEEAFASYATSKGLAPARFDWHGFRTTSARIIEFFTKERLDTAPRATRLSRRPIFIASMPRSGTTLLERQIAAHPQAAGAGETDALHAQVTGWSDTSSANACWPFCVRGLVPGELSAIADRYLAGTARFAGPGVERVADKHLANWTYVGLIAMAFPEATIVHLERDPIDTGLSCFERLQSSSMPWSATLEGIGEMLACAERMLEHWHAVLPGRMVRVRYEDLVRNPRSELGRVLDAAGLPWDDACLAHERPRRGRLDPPPTLSAEQAARPLSDASIGRADRFGPALDPLRASLAAHRAASR